MPCSRTQHGAACGDPTQDLSIRSPMLYHYATAPPQISQKDNVVSGKTEQTHCIVPLASDKNKKSCQFISEYRKVITAKASVAFGRLV